MDRLAIISPTPMTRVIVDMACTPRYSVDEELCRAKVEEVIKDIKKKITEDCLEFLPAAITMVPTRLFNE